MSVWDNFIYNLTSSDNITTNKIFGLVVVCILLYIFVFFVFEEYFPYLHKLSYMKCFYHCNGDLCKSIISTRGEDYSLKYNGKVPKDCGVTPYEVSHIIFHIFIGYYFNIYYSLGIGIPFEIHEAMHYQCESYMDIFYNTIGASIGILLRSF
jgi:hypothetical protein